jgi:tetratricopeptide (TPR) repeat protein
VITFYDTLNWLDWETPTKLDRRHQRLLLELQTASQPRAERICGYFFDYLTSEYEADDEGEILVYLGVYHYLNGRLPEALDYLNQALEVLDSNVSAEKEGNPSERRNKDAHRLALVDWMMHYVFCMRGNPDKAFDWLHKAMRNFNDRACFYHHIKDHDREKWYRERMIDTGYETVATIRSIYGCLFEFTSSRLCPPACQARERTLEFITNGRFSEATREIALLKKISENSFENHETAEVLVISGITNAERGNCREAESEIITALARCEPAGHEQVFIRWMMALIQLNQAPRRAEAIHNMEICIRQVDGLATAADHQNYLYKRIWYEVYREAMIRFLQDRVSSSGPAAGYTPDPNDS